VPFSQHCDNKRFFEERICQATNRSVRHMCVFNLNVQLSNWGLSMLETATVLIVGFGLGSHARTLVTIVASQRPLPIDGAADNLPNLRIRQE
jgi:hypothetical protein